jgi:hypothetical protein
VDKARLLVETQLSFLAQAEAVRGCRARATHRTLRRISLRAPCRSRRRWKPCASSWTACRPRGETTACWWCAALPAATPTPQALAATAATAAGAAGAAAIARSRPLRLGGAMGGRADALVAVAAGASAPCISQSLCRFRRLHRCRRRCCRRRQRRHRRMLRQHLVVAAARGVRRPRRHRCWPRCLYRCQSRCRQRRRRRVRLCLRARPRRHRCWPRCL